jgi:hypothetical protein
MRWTGHVTDMGENGNQHKILLGKMEGNGQLGKLFMVGSVILTRVLNKQDGSAWTGFVSLGVGTVLAVVNTVMKVHGLYNGDLLSS